MYSKEELKSNKLEFWSKLEDQLNRQKNPDGSKVNWMNYNTGIKDLYFRMEADSSAVRLCIDLQFNDAGIREIYFEQFVEFKTILDDKFNPKLQWLPNFDHSNGKTIARIYTEKIGVDINNRKDWDKMHLFLKLNFVKLDAFWDEFDAVFKALK